MEKEKLVIIGANDFQNQLILKAKSLGYETHVFAWQCGDVGEFTADYFYPVSIIEKEQITEMCKEINPVGVCTIASDLAATTVSYVADQLQLPGNPFKDNLIQTNKYAMREALEKAGVACPKFYKVNTESDLSQIILDYPAIVKPTDRSGSRSIWKIESPDELKSAVADACESSFEKSSIVEEYITGPEYSCESISYQGKHTTLAITKKFTTGAPHFIETGHMEPSDIPSDIEKNIIMEIHKALDALHVQNGASHAEFRLQDDGTIRIIEIGARMGGDCIGSDLVQISTGYDFVKMVIDVACGKRPDFSGAHEIEKVQIRFMFTKDDVAEMEKIREENPGRIVRVSDLDYSHEGSVTDSSTRIGYYIIKG